MEINYRRIIILYLTIAYPIITRVDLDIQITKFMNIICLEGRLILVTSKIQLTSIVF